MSDNKLTATHTHKFKQTPIHGCKRTSSVTHTHTLGQNPNAKRQSRARKEKRKPRTCLPKVQRGRIKAAPSPSPPPCPFAGSTLPLGCGGQRRRARVTHGDQWPSALSDGLSRALLERKMQSAAAPAGAFAHVDDIERRQLCVFFFPPHPHSFLFAQNQSHSGRTHPQKRKV